MIQLFNTISARIPATGECVRLFHGRGKMWPGLEHLSIDIFSAVILITTYKEITESEKIELTNTLKSIPELKFECILLQKRYIKNEDVEILFGALPSDVFAVENSEKYLINLTNPQNIGFFLDMAIGRSRLKKISSGKKVLNLFSYTCSLSVAALKGGASEVINVDMSKPALGVGEKNHKLNGLDLRQAKFLPHDIMKSFGNISKKGPYDIIIIDPPTNQGESFRGDRDYHKIIRRLPEMCSKNAVVMACLNSPFLRSEFLIDAFKEHAPQFILEEKIYSSFSSQEVDPEEGLKILFFRNV